MAADPPNLKPLPSRPKPPAAPDGANHPTGKRPPTLTFTDGLNFGCGFWIAGAVFFGALSFGLLLLGILSRLN